ncbi:hypothetical protein CJ030_MR4G029043 [Morella rubra]|uniref:non-specific serine/threonine protein kinase n=1 Tax=Morella rubra TaxID=262757 RepID=A0A6A1VX38_9ROSI|nr:hypothetical protein CJ030_MR4G029043 [Morella rubra]
MTWYNLSINFGGQEVTVNGSTAYAADTKIGGPSSFFQSSSNWAFSSTGNFMDGHPTDTYIVKNSSVLSMPNPELYMNIMFTDDKTFSSLGRRIFDVYIQGKLVMKDFDIVKRAGGVAKAVIERFDVVVTDNTMEIRFYWAGKGTTDIPVKGVYGPLIFAISVFIPPSETENSTQNGNSIPVEAVAGIVAAGAFVICFWLWVSSGGKLVIAYGTSRNLSTYWVGGFKGFGLAHWKIYLEAIRAATNDFDAANKIGEGGFSPVYKGFLSDGTVIAVKQLSSESRQGNREFLNEIGVISALQHPHLVKLYGCCIEGNQLLLVYEYMENNSLARALFGPEEHQLKLDWPTRQQICVGIARGLAYLHEESRLKIVHRDIKATNVLLDRNLNP